MFWMYNMKWFLWFFVPVASFSPVWFRYFRIQGKTNPFLKEVYTHTTGKIVSSFIPLEGAFPDIVKDTLYECIENKTMVAEYVARHFLLQIISHEINDGVHEVFKKISHSGN